MMMSDSTIPYAVAGAAFLLGGVSGVVAYRAVVERAWPGWLWGLPAAYCIVAALLATTQLHRLYYLEKPLLAVIGTVSVVYLYRSAGRDPLEGSWYLLVLFCAAVMVAASVQMDQLSYMQAVMILLLGGVTLVSASRAITLLFHGAAIELQTDWSGLGGGLGGWRLSPVVGLLFLALASGGGAIALVGSIANGLTPLAGDQIAAPGEATFKADESTADQPASGQ